MLSLIKRNKPFGIDAFLDDLEKDVFGLFDNEIGPKYHIYNKENEDVVEVLIPGIKKDEVKISTENNLITVSAETTKKDKNSFGYMKFERSFANGDKYDLDKTEAKLENGVLTLTMPLRKKREGPKIINIK